MTFYLKFNGIHWKKMQMKRSPCAKCQSILLDITTLLCHKYLFLANIQIFDFINLAAEIHSRRYCVTAADCCGWTLQQRCRGPILVLSFKCYRRQTARCVSVRLVTPRMPSLIRKCTNICRQTSLVPNAKNSGKPIRCFFIGRSPYLSEW